MYLSFNQPRSQGRFPGLGVGWKSGKSPWERGCLLIYNIQQSDFFPVHLQLYWDQYSAPYQFNYINKITNMYRSPVVFH